MEGVIRSLNTHFAEHELFEFRKKPFASDPLYIVGGIYINGNISQVLNYFIQDLHKLSVSTLSYL